MCRPCVSRNPWLLVGKNHFDRIANQIENFALAFPVGEMSIQFPHASLDPFGRVNRIDVWRRARADVGECVLA